MWVTGQPYDMNRDLNMWRNGSSVLEGMSDKTRDCIAMDPDGGMEWFEDNCDSRHSFICMKSKCCYLLCY